MLPSTNSEGIAEHVTPNSVNEQQMVVGELVIFNHNVHAAVLQLQSRMTKLENENELLHSMLAQGAEVIETRPYTAQAAQHSTQDRDNINKRSCSPSHTPEEYRSHGDLAMSLRGAATSSARKKGARKHLQIQIPGKMFTSSQIAGLPTPLSRAAVRIFQDYFQLLFKANTKPQTTLSAGTTAPVSSFPKMPVTPGRIGPHNTGKKSVTSINKRGNHNLDKTMPPPYAQIPMVPLTDTEIIVYFFQSLSRPMVSLRLYARNWGPRNIVEVLHDHREIEPPYLRNTCSVKCTTAIKKGKDKFGDDWERAYREVFSQAFDEQATDLVHLEDDELMHAMDYDIRSLSVGIKKHPKLGVDGGIFTQCVQYCHEHNAPYTLNNVWQLAADLQYERIPQHPPSPVSPVVKRYGSRRHRRKVLEEETSSEHLDIHSPTAETKQATSQHIRANSPTLTLLRSLGMGSSVEKDDDLAHTLPV